LIIELNLPSFAWFSWFGCCGSSGLRDGDLLPSSDGLTEGMSDLGFTGVSTTKAGLISSEGLTF
jgi:hypothetical protein